MSKLVKRGCLGKVPLPVQLTLVAHNAHDELRALHTHNGHAMGCRSLLPCAARKVAFCCLVLRKLRNGQMTATHTHRLIAAHSYSHCL